MLRYLFFTEKTMTSRNRNSSIELLRIIIMYMILLLHANFLTFGAPQGHSLLSFARCFAEAFTLTPVNIFILISGFFGTSFSLKKVMGLVYLVLFCVLPISLLFIACHVVDFELDYLDFRRYWFINAYIGLVIVSPVLNAAVERFSRKVFKTFLISFYVIALIDAQICIFGINISQGYSLVWFIFLYMLGRYLKQYPPSFTTRQLLLAIVLSCLGQALVLMYLHRDDYVEPFVVIQSVATLLLFAKYEFHNRAVNAIAGSVVMVYLFNLHPILLQYFMDSLRYLSQHFSMVSFLMLALMFCAAVFIIAILYDKLRLYTWHKLLTLYSTLTQQEVK